MNKRFINFFLCFLLVFFLTVECTPKSKAITPAEGLVAASLASFIISGGIELLWDNKEATAQSLIDDMSTLWGAFYDFDNSVPSSLSSFPSDSVTFDDNGTVVLTRDTAQTYQGFLDFLKNHYDMVPDSMIDLVSSGSQSATNTNYPSNRFNYQIYNPPITFTNGSLSIDHYYGSTLWTFVYTVSDNSAPVSLIPAAYNSTGSGGFYVFSCSSAPFSVTQNEYIGDSFIRSYSMGVSNLNTTWGSIYVCYIPYTSGGTHDVVPEIPLNVFVNGNFSNGFSCAADFYGFIYGDGSVVSNGGGLIGNIGNAIGQQIYGMLDTDTVTVSAGVAEPIADEEDYVSAVVGGIAVPGTANPSVSIVGAQGVTELYPDVPATDIDSLGLPDLGAALVRRFPFSIPWDVYNIFSALNVPATPIDVDIDFLPQSFKNKLHITGDTSVHLDLTVSPYDKLVLLVRWGCFTGFLLSLAYGTKRLIWTTGG